MCSKARRFILTCLALLALGWAQVFGMMRGYVCDWGGQVEITAFDHCHGPHRIACHDHDDLSPTHEHEDHPDDSDTHEHEPLTEALQTQPVAGQMAFAFAPVLAVIATLEVIPPSFSLNENTLPNLPPPRDDGSGRRWSQVLTRTIALRV